MAQAPDPAVTLAIWIGAFGKALVKKGVLTQAEVIGELNDVKSRMAPTNPHSSGMIAEIDNMIAAVRKW
jgi:hypothetical protein